MTDTRDMTSEELTPAEGPEPFPREPQQPVIANPPTGEASGDSPRSSTRGSASGVQRRRWRARSGGPAASEASKGRRKALAAAVAVAVAVLLLGYAATVFVRSPAQRAAETAPPPPSLVTAVVETKVLADAVVSRATVVAQGTVNAVPTGVPAGAGRAVISKLPVAAGGVRKAGEVAVEVSGRPVVILQGPVPAYRDLSQGATGQDVVQLQDALGQIGHPTTPDAHGVFGAATAKAVAAMYQAVGYSLPAGPMVPMDEVVFVNRVPVTVFSLAARVGQDAGQAKVLLSDGPLVAMAPVTSTSQTVLRDGLKATITSELLNKTVDGVVSLSTSTGSGAGTGSAAATAGASGAGSTSGGSAGPASGGADASSSSGAAPSLVITPAQPLGPEWAGQDVRVDVQSATTRGAVLAVPSTAVVMGSDGKTAVVKVTGGGSTAQQQRVPVEVGASGGGFVEIRVPDGQIKAQDKVLVGAS